MGSKRRYNIEGDIQKSWRRQLITRLAVFSIVGPVAIRCVVKGFPALNVLAVVGVAGASHEAGRLLKLSGVPVSALAVVGTSLAILEAGPAGYFLAVPLVLADWPDATVGRVKLLQVWSASAVGSYVGMPIYAGMEIRRSENGVSWLVYGLVSTWASDATAYLMGPHMPGPSLPGWLNDRKKWFGYLPGVVFSMAIGAIAAPRLKIPRMENMFLGSLIGVSSAVGDMLESGLKRQAQQADAGNFLPGYGGILDRLDSMLATNSILYWAYRKWAPQSPRR